MRCMKRNKRQLYVCSKYEENGIVKFNYPQVLKMNYQVTNSDGDLIALGMNYPMYIRIKTDLKYKDFFKAKYRLYVGIEPSEPFNPLCKDANYEVESEPIVSNNVVEIVLKKLSGKV